MQAFCKEMGMEGPSWWVKPDVNKAVGVTIFLKSEEMEVWQVQVIVEGRWQWMVVEFEKKVIEIFNCSSL